jgi:hypothetical protein
MRDFADVHLPLVSTLPTIGIADEPSHVGAVGCVAATPRSTSGLDAAPAWQARPPRTLRLVRPPMRETRSPRNACRAAASDPRRGRLGAELATRRPWRRLEPTTLGGAQCPVSP